MSNFLLLDVNGTVGTDQPPLIEYLNNPESFPWMDRVHAYVNKQTLNTIKDISEKYDVTVLWISLRANDALSINSLIDVNWDYLELNGSFNGSNTWPKTAPIVEFYKQHPNSIIVVCDDMLRVNGAYNELKNEAPQIKTVIPPTTTGIRSEELNEIEQHFDNQNRKILSTDEFFGPDWRDELDQVEDDWI